MKGQHKYLVGVFKKLLLWA